MKESVRLVRTGTLIEQIGRDVRYACRGLLGAPGFTLTVVLTMGLGIGVNTAVFSVIDATLFRPLPYERPEELVMLGRERAGMTVRARMSWDDVARWRTRTDLFQGVEVSGGGRAWHWLERDEEVVVAAFTRGRDALVPVAAGIAAGALVAWWATGLIASQLYGVGPRDPLAFALASVALLLAATLAALAPVRRATGVDPIVALRAE